MENDAAQDAAMDVNSTTEESTTSFGTLDYVLLLVTVAIAVLLLMRYRRKKKDDEIKQLMIDPR